MGYINDKYGDCSLPTEWERQKLCEMISWAFIEIDRLALNRELERVAALTRAFHNLPQLLYSEHFSLNYFRSSLKVYHSEYPQNETGGDFLEMLDKIIRQRK
jgi:hypothetical protein